MCFLYTLAIFGSCTHPGNGGEVSNYMSASIQCRFNSKIKLLFVSCIVPIHDKVRENRERKRLKKKRTKSERTKRENKERDRERGRGRERGGEVWLINLWVILE